MEPRLKWSQIILAPKIILAAKSCLMLLVAVTVNLRIQRTDARDHICVSQRLVIDVKVSFCAYKLLINFDILLF